MKYYIYILLSFLVLIAACKKDKEENGNLPLSVKSFWPNSGNAGTIVTISGTGFGSKAAGNEVSFNGTAAKIVDVRDSVLIVLAPDNGTSGAIVVTSNNQKISAGEYTYQALSLRGISPSNGAAGTNVSISGAGFSSISAPAKVTINGKDAFITSINDTLIVAAVPVAAGSGQVKVMVDGKEVSGPAFTFQNISGIKPAKGGKGTQVTISGEGFGLTGADNLVAFNGKTAVVVSASGNQLTVIAPADVATGPVTVSVGGEQTVGPVFAVIPPPLLNSVAPLSGPAGTEVAITGDYFSNVADEISVSFNGKPAITSMAADKKVTVKVPAGAGKGKIIITVNGQETQGPEFTEQNLGVSLLLPDNGLAGTSVTIKGLGFSTTPGNNIVSFNGVLTSVISATETELTVNAPAGVTTGAVNVKVNGIEAKGPEFKRAGVMTLAGGPGKSDFNFINGIAADRQGNVFAVDGNMVKKITADGVVSIFAGGEESGSTNDNGTSASFNFPVAIAIDGNDNLYVADRFNLRIRKITPSGDVTTYSSLSFQPVAVAVDKHGNVYAGAQYQGVYQINPSGIATRMSNQSYETAGFICVDNNGVTYYAPDYDYNSIFKIEGGVKSVFSGSNYGFNDGTLTTALFRQPEGLAYSRSSGIMYTTDNNAIKSIADGLVTTITGTQGGTIPASGYVDGGFGDALFNDITNICVDSEGNLYIAERNNKSIRKIFFR